MSRTPKPSKAILRRQALAARLRQVLDALPVDEPATRRLVDPCSVAIAVREEMTLQTPLWMSEQIAYEMVRHVHEKALWLVDPTNGVGLGATAPGWNDP